MDKVPRGRPKKSIAGKKKINELRLVFRSANIVFPYTLLHPSPKQKKLKKKTSSKGNVQLFEVNDHFLISLLDLGKEYKMIKPFEATSIHSHLCSSHLLL